MYWRYLYKKMLWIGSECKAVVLSVASVVASAAAAGDVVAVDAST